MNITMSTLLGVTKGKLMGDIGDLYKFYEGYIGEPVFTHQMTRLFEQTSDTIIAQHPFINDVDLSLVNKDNYKVILSNLISEHGDRFQIARPLLSGHLVKDPLTELVDRVVTEKVIVVETE